MKFFFIFFVLFFQVNAFAGQMVIVARDRIKNLTPIELDAEELQLDNDAEQFKYFNIVKGVNEVAEPLSRLSESERLRVVTLGYHLTKARDYFTNVLKVGHLNKNEKMTIRYDMARSFSSGRHFTTSENETNNAVTNKASNQYILPGVNKWGTEIWFRPAVEEVKKSSKGGILDSTSGLQDDLLNLADTAVVDLTKEITLGLGTSYFDYNHYISQVGLLIVMKKIVPSALDFAASTIPFKVKLDSAMVPEIIYHEFAHVALSDYIPLTGSFTVSEGMANYFASVISGNTVIAGKLGEYGTNIEPIKIDSHLRYRSRFESDSNMAHGPFTYNYLWAMRERISKEVKVENENSARVFDRIVFESRKYIDFSTDSTITKSLPESLMKASGAIGLDLITAREVRLIISQTAKKLGM